MQRYFFRISVGLDFYIFEVMERASEPGKVVVQLVVRGATEGETSGSGVGMKAAVLNAMKSLLPTKSDDSGFMSEAGEQFSLQLVSLPV